MKTAIIVSGIMREMHNAMPTWTFPGDCDYFLIVQDTYQAPRESNQSTSILPELANFHDKFKAIAIVDKNIAELEYMTTLTNQTWKWKVAYNLIKPYIDKFRYDRFILIRPDSFLLINGNINEIELRPNCIHSTSEITLDTMGETFANDTLMMFDEDMFELLSKFFDYIEPISHTLNIHQHLANFLRLNNIEVTGELLKYMQTMQLRPSLHYMFENNKLADKYTVNDLFRAIIEWKKD